MANKEMKTLTFGNDTYEIVDEKARKDLEQKIPKSDKGKPNGIASLDNNGKVPSNQLPEIKSYGVGGDTLGLVKNGGNVIINGDGTMTAPEAEGGNSSIQPDWNATDVTNGAIKNKPPIEKGQGENSLQQIENNAIGNNAVALGKNASAGCKGFYIKSINMTNKIIYLCNEKITPEISVNENVDSEFETPAYSEGDRFSIINGSHYVLCGTITSIEGNVLCYDGDLGFSEIAEDTDPEGHTLFVPSKPTVGTVMVTNISYAIGEGVVSSGRSGHAEGRDTLVAGNYGHAEGRNTIAGYAGHAENLNTQALGLYTHAEGQDSKAFGTASHAEGYNTQANAYGAHSEGGNTKADGEWSHAEGYFSEANGKWSHAEGRSSVANGMDSHAEGYLTEANEYCSHSEGDCTKAEGTCSHAEGNRTYAIGPVSHAEGQQTEAKEYAHSEGTFTHAYGHSSHTEGASTLADDYCAHAEGYSTKAYAMASHSEGRETIARYEYQHVQGKFNIEDTENKYAHIVGGGSSDVPLNLHTVSWSDGQGFFKGGTTTEGADYAEYFEWLDGNPNHEDRVGLLVALDGDKIKFANSDDEILGIISGTAAVLGDNYECEWNGKYLTDDFGRIQYEMVEEFIEVLDYIDEETNKPVMKNKSVGFFKHPILNPDYDPTKEYTNRADRPEWDAVGMLGKLFVKDDGTCEVNGYATVGENGIATASTEKTNMRVLSRVNENVIRVLLK